MVEARELVGRGVMLGDEHLLKTEIDLEVARDFIAGDFGDVQLCTAVDLKMCLKRAVRQSVQLSMLSVTPRNDTLWGVI